jgi:hypothetical protein
MLPIDTLSRSGSKRCGLPSPHGATPAAPAPPETTAARAVGPFAVARRRAAVAGRCATIGYLARRKSAVT